MICLTLTRVSKSRGVGSENDFIKHEEEFPT